MASLARPVPTLAAAPALAAVRSLLAAHGIASDRLETWKDGSNLLVRPWPAPVILRVATFTGRIRRDPIPYLAREVALVEWLADRGAPVMGPSTVMPPGPFLVDGWGIAAFSFVEHEAGVIPEPVETLESLDALHECMRDYPGELPYLGPATEDLDLAVAFAVDEGIIAPQQAHEIGEHRDELLARIGGLDPTSDPQHGDAYPRNAVVDRSGGVTWIDLEDACRGPVAWDLAVLVRNTGDARVRAAAEERVGRETLETASALRVLQGDVWAALHAARVVRGW